MDKVTKVIIPFFATFYRLTRYGFVGALFAGFVLFSSACGGGDSSTGSGSTNGPDSMPPTFEISFSDRSSAPNSKNNISEASGNAPKAGSVTQSSNAMNNVTTDSVSAEVSYDSRSDRPVFNVVKTGNAGFRINSSSNEMSRPIQGSELPGVEMLRCEEGRGCLYVGVQTTHSGPQQTDADYLAAGFWGFFPDNPASAAGFELGAFVDGGDKFAQQNLAGLTGTDTTYQGIVTGVFSPPGGPQEGNYLFTAEVELTVDFGDGEALGTIIEGTISNVRDEDGTRVEGNPQITLGSANIGGSHSGFFTGDTRMNYRGASYVGKWGGQFFGNNGDEPGSVAGTFGVDAGNGSSALGVFMAVQP